MANKRLKLVEKMTVTVLVTYLVKMCCILTGTKSWMITNTQKYQLLNDSAFWITLANLAMCPFVILLAISRKSSDFMLLVRLFVVAVSMTSCINNLLVRRKRYIVERECSSLVKEYGRVSRPYLLFIPISFITILINTIALNKDETWMLVMLCYSSSIANESYINLRTLAITHRYTEISRTLSTAVPSNAEGIITSCMEAHRDCSKLVEMLNGCHMLDYFLLSSACLVRNIYIVIGVFQDVMNVNQAIDSVDMISTLLYLLTVSGRFCLTCWSGTHLTISSDSCLESALNYKFYHYAQMKQTSKEMVDILIHQLQERKVSLSVFGMYDLGLGTFTTFVEVTVTYAIVVVNTISTTTVAHHGGDEENVTISSIILNNDI